MILILLRHIQKLNGLKFLNYPKLLIQLKINQNKENSHLIKDHLKNVLKINFKTVLRVNYLIKFKINLINHQKILKN